MRQILDAQLMDIIVEHVYHIKKGEMKMPRGTRVLIDADPSLETWRYISEAGDFPLFDGNTREGDIILRWGANHSSNTGRFGSARVLNPRIVLSKITQGQLFEEHQVSFPKPFWNHVSWERAGRPEVVVKQDIGQMGTGMSKTTRPTFRQGTLTQLYVPKVREFRCMAVHDLIGFFMEKHEPANHDFRWNEHRGSEWSSVPEDRALRSKVKALSAKALEAVGYDFGAVDIIQDAAGALYVLEVNSRPEFGRVNSEHFVRAINEFLSRR